MIKNWIARLRLYFEDKQIAEKCGMVYKDVCVHESIDESGEILEGKWRPRYTCNKCGEKFYQ